MTQTQSAIVERALAFPPEKVWRALTQPHLIEQWLMKNDFDLALGHPFTLRGDWGGVLNCKVLGIEPFNDLGEVSEAAGKPVDLVDDDDVDLAFIN